LNNLALAAASEALSFAHLLVHHVLDDHGTGLPEASL
jgi:hypothetical protein